VVTLTLKSRASGSTVVFHGVLHVPSARRTLICIGKAMRSGVYWHFNSRRGGYISVANAGYWGDMKLSHNDLLFLEPDVIRPQHPTMQPAATRSVFLANVEIANAELNHHRLGHPGHTVMKHLASKQLIPADAAAPLQHACLTCATCKHKSISRAPILNPATRPLQCLHADLITVAITGLHGEHYALVLTDQYSGYIDALPLVRKSDSADALVEGILFYERQLQPPAGDSAYIRSRW
jgi:hypothetical protein